MTKSDEDLVWLDILRKSAKFQCMTDDLTEIFCSIRLFRNIFYTFPSNNISTVDTILIRFAWTHETVGCHQNTAGDSIKLLLLILPCSTKISNEMGIFFQPLITVGRQHFSVSINIDSRTLGLLEQHFQIFQVVTGYNDERSFPDMDIDGVRGWISVDRSICLI